MTDTDICNMALSNIGKGVIENMEEGVENARACKLFYEPTRRECLRSFPWGFAHRVERLAVVDVDVPGWDFAYAYPDKCLMIRNVASDASGADRVYERFDVVNIGFSTKVVVTNGEQCYADYTWDVSDPELMDVIFLQGFAHLLASKLAMRLTGNPQQAQNEYQLYRAAISQAQLQDAREMEPHTMFESSYIAARRGWRHG